ncbi:acyltransferase family protein [Methylibium sp.]|uniref:acyltransferase family protein n=1 Tax=Methylibium sp. TaxID=2067992 RepID=UPI003D0BB42C
MAADLITTQTQVMREGWVDSAKGVGIILVVVGHAIGGMIDAGLLSRTGLANEVFFAIYTFHMPMFFFLSGLFVARRISADRSGFLKATFFRILWPYLLWSVIQTTLIQASGQLVNRPVEWGSFNYLSIVWQPASQFWFLHVLVLLSIFSYLIVPHFGVRALVVFAVTLFAVPEIATLPATLKLACHFGLMYALGVASGQFQEPGQLATRGTRSVVGIAASATAWLAIVSVLLDRGERYWTIAALPAAISGSVAWLWLSATPLVTNSALVRMLGQRSMVIYLLHVLFVASTRIVLDKLVGLTEPAAILAAVVLAGLIGPLVIYSAASRLRIVRKLGLG